MPAKGRGRELARQAEGGPGGCIRKACSPRLGIDLGKGSRPGHPFPREAEEIRQRPGDLQRTAWARPDPPVHPLFITIAPGLHRLLRAQNGKTKRKGRYHRMEQQVTEAKLSALQAQVGRISL
jgi:hypothetical protein